MCVPEDDGFSFSTTSFMNTFIFFQYLRRMLPDESTTKAISSTVLQSGDTVRNFKWKFLIGLVDMYKRWKSNNLRGWQLNKVKQETYRIVTAYFN